MKRIVLFVMLVHIFGASLFAQDMNRTDSKGRRQGLWTDVYANGSTRYKGKFKNDKPVGEFSYYDEAGNLKAINVYDKTGANASYTGYSSNGRVVASGNYKDKRKEGEWCYFSPESGKKILVENYANGVLQGKSVVYDAVTGRVAEEVFYKDGKREGRCVKFYADGKVMAEISYVSDKRDGNAKFYYPNGLLQEEGSFCLDNKCGEWKIYSDEGDLLDTESYDERPIVGVHE